jgi:hypothetical protein
LLHYTIFFAQESIFARKESFRAVTKNFAQSLQGICRQWPNIFRLRGAGLAVSAEGAMVAEDLLALCAPELLAHGGVPRGLLQVANETKGILAQNINFGRTTSHDQNYD